MGSSPAADPELSKLREELLASVASIFDRAVEMGRRKGAEAVLATINDTARKMAGLSASVAMVSGSSGTLTGLRAADGTSDAKEGRARSGAVQGAVLVILGKSPAPLAPRRIVEAGKEMGHDLKVSSVRMALMALSKAGRVAQDAHGDYHLAPGGATVEADPPCGANNNNQA